MDLIPRSPQIPRGFGSPDCFRSGLADPVALLIGESAETEEALNRAGFRFFSSVKEFKDYVRSGILGPAGAETMRDLQKAARRGP